MERLIELLVSAKAWEVVVTLVGSYLAAKGLEGLSRKLFLCYILVAFVFGFAAIDFLLPWAVESSHLSESAAINLKPFALLLASAISLKAMDLLYGWLAQLKDIKLKDLKFSFSKDRKND